MLQALLVALRLWGSLPASTLQAISLLPSQVQPPPEGFFQPSETPKSADATAAAAAFFSEQHLQKILPILRASSSSHPRLHTVWPTLLALLLPGFTAVKVTVVPEARGPNVPIPLSRLVVQTLLEHC